MEKLVNDVEKLSYKDETNQSYGEENNSSQLGSVANQR